MKEYNYEYHVSYVEGCTPKIKSFYTKYDASKFVANFMLKHQFANIDDNWINMVFKGDIVYIDPTTPHEGK